MSLPRLPTSGPHSMADFIANYLQPLLDNLAASSGLDPSVIPALSDRIAAEVVRATGAEGALQSSQTAEITRAIAAELTLSLRATTLEARTLPLAGLAGTEVSYKPTAREIGYLYPIYDAIGRRALGINLDGQTVVGALKLGPNLAPETGFSEARIDRKGRTVGFALDGSLKAPVGHDKITWRKDDDSRGRVYPRRDIIINGDSFVEGVGAGPNFGALLQTAFPGRRITSRGISGTNAEQIAAAQGGRPALVTVTGNTIPGSGSVAATPVPPLNNGGRASMAFVGSLAGVQGALISDTATPANWTFLRSGSGAAVACPAGTPFLPEVARGDRGCTQIIWAGRNNVYSIVDQGTGAYSPTAFASWRDSVVAMADSLDALNKNYLILSPTTTQSTTAQYPGFAAEPAGSYGYDAVMRMNAYLKTVFGERFVDVRRYLIDQGLEIASGGGVLDLAGRTTQAKGYDDADIAADTVPYSLRVDHLHPNAPGKYVSAQLLIQIIRVRGI